MYPESNEDAGVDTRELLDRIGRSRLGKFSGGDYSELALVKQQEREKVAAFILKYFPRVGPKVLSMPGTSWAFELRLIRSAPMTHVVGVEMKPAIYLQAKRAMPMLCLHNVNPQWREFALVSERMCQYGTEHYTYARTMANEHAQKTRSSHRLVMMRMSTFLSMLISDYGQTKGQRCAFHRRFCSRNAAWLDFTGSMSTELENCLRFLPFALEAPHISQAKPVVVTLFNGHDNFRGVESRIKHLTHVQPLFKPVEHWTYVGKNGSPMLTVCGEIV